MPSFRFVAPNVGARSPLNRDVPVHVSDSRPPVVEDPGAQTNDMSHHAILVSNILRELSQDGKPVEGTNMLESNYFQIPVALLIMVNTIQLGLEADYPEQDELWSVFEHVITAGFTVEFLIKLFILRGAYFCAKGNILDFVLVALSVLDVWILKYVLSNSQGQLKSFSVLRFLRLSKILRMLRMLEIFESLVVILEGVISALSTACWVGVLLTMVMYAFAIFCVQFIGREGSHLYPGHATEADLIDQNEVIQNFNPFTTFGSIPKAMVTLFNMAVLAEWTEVIRPLMVKQPWLVLIFIVFLLFSTFGIMNVMVGMIVDGVMKITANFRQEADEKKTRSKQRILQEIQKVVFEVDCDSDGVVTLEELEQCWSHTTLAFLLDQVNLPRGLTPRELFRMLDDDGDGKVERDEFVHSFFRLIENDEFQRSVMDQIGLNHIKVMMREMHEANQRQIKELQSTFQAQMENVVRAIQQHAVTRDASYAQESVELAREPPCKSRKVLSPAAHGLQGSVWIERCPDLTQRSVMTELEVAVNNAEGPSKLVLADDHPVVLFAANRPHCAVGESPRTFRIIPEASSPVQPAVGSGWPAVDDVDALAQSLPCSEWPAVDDVDELVQSLACSEPKPSCPAQRTEGRGDVENLRSFSGVHNAQVKPEAWV